MLREFPKIRRAAMAGEDVIVQTREGNLRITAEKPETSSILGCLSGQIKRMDDDLDKPTSDDVEWSASL